MKKENTKEQKQLMNKSINQRDVKNVWQEILMVTSASSPHQRRKHHNEYSEIRFKDEMNSRMVGCGFEHLRFFLDLYCLTLSFLPFTLHTHILMEQIHLI